MNKGNRHKGIRTDDLPDPATQSAPKPGDYSLGSLKSRAAARAMAEAQKEDVGDHEET
jgi:hypothetical protein